LISKATLLHACMRACLPLSTTSLLPETAVWHKNRRTCDIQSSVIDVNRHSASVSVNWPLHCDVTHTVTTKMIPLHAVHSFNNYSYKPYGRR
jgi:hypothetical protein